MKRRIVQLAAIPETENTCAMVYAVAHDGTAWQFAPNSGRGWQKLPELPKLVTEEDRLRAQFPDGQPGTAAEEMSAEDEEDARALGEQIADERRTLAEQERAADELAARRNRGGVR